MTLTVCEALRLIDLARKQMVRFEKEIGCCSNCVLARASYGALLEYLRAWVESGPMEAAELAALAPLEAWADRERPGWRNGK